MQRGIEMRSKRRAAIHIHFERGAVNEHIQMEGARME
jgi:hypothetical protein